jgi:hypothetical protein
LRQPVGRLKIGIILPAGPIAELVKIARLQHGVQSLTDVREIIVPNDLSELIITNEFSHQVPFAYNDWALQQSSFSEDVAAFGKVVIGSVNDVGFGYYLIEHTLTGKPLEMAVDVWICLSCLQ